MAMTVRRVVTGNAGGKSKIVSDGATRRSRAFKNIPGQSSALVWSTPAVPTLPIDGADVISEKSSYLPLQPGETRLMVVTFAPDSVMMTIDPVAGFQEFAEHVPDLAATMEPDSPGMHTTQTVDYGIVLEGEVWAELDDGKQVHLKPHDIIVQNGTRHAWRNKTDKPVKIAFVLIGARKKS
jgi:mannose-6-phosphate isomerase-like protein (cupin superfamily)